MKPLLAEYLAEAAALGRWSRRFLHAFSILASAFNKDFGGWNGTSQVGDQLTDGPVCV